MVPKLLVTIIIATVSMHFLSACRKREIIQIDSVQTPVIYYLPKINGAHDWSGTYGYYLNAHLVDTNSRFALKTISDSIVVVDIPNRAETLYYYQTDEIAKTILFNGIYDNSNDNYFSLYLTYYYGDNHIVYEEYYYHSLGGFNAINISDMILHSP